MKITCSICGKPCAPAELRDMGLQSETIVRLCGLARARANGRISP